MRDLQLPGRSPSVARQGMAATSHTLATQAALDILKAGGNALDAAIAACAVQCVVEPGSTGIGGDCFALYAPAGRAADMVAYNGSGRAPAGATVERLRELGVSDLTRTSPHSVIVPGAVDAWCRLNADHGAMAMADILAPAITHARDGYPIGQRVAADFEKNAGHLTTNENLAAVFLSDGKPPAFGAMHRQPGLADALEAIGREGRDVFYRGHLASEMVETLNALGGLHTMADFADAKGEYVTPITTEFAGHTVHECPPNGQGVIALLMLNMVEGRDLGELLSVERIHHELEVCRRGYAARSSYLADPHLAEVPVEGLLSRDYAERLAGTIDPERMTPPPMDAVRALPHRDTVYITVVDRDRNVCSFINTLFWGFGGGITTKKHGIVLTNRGQGFVLDESHPNCIAPGKRPLHTIIPGMVSRGGRVTMGFGVMGGEYQAMGHLQFLTRALVDGMDPQAAQDAPRWMVDPYTGEVEIETTVPEATVERLRAMGHEIDWASAPIGGSQAIAIDWDEGVLIGGSDPRKDGCAAGY